MDAVEDAVEGTTEGTTEGMDAGRAAEAECAAEVAAEIEAAIRSVAGVSDLFRAGSLVSNAVDRGARRLGLRDEDGQLVLVQRAGAEVRVKVALGVHASSSVAATTRAVHRAVRDLLDHRDLRDAHIVVTVVHVDDSPLL